MAVVRARSSPPYALIIFIFLWVVATALAVLFYLQYDKAGKDKEQADHLRDRAAKLSDTQLVDQYLTGQTGKSAIRAADEQVKKLKMAIAGNTPKSVDEINDQVTELLDKVGKNSQPLISAVSTLSSDVARAQTEKQAAEDTLEKEKKVYEAAKEQYLAAIKAANASVDEQKDSVRKLSDQLAAANALVASTTEKDEKELTTAKESAEQVRRDLVLKLEAKDNEIKILNNKVAYLTQALNNLRPVARMNVGREPDGLIVRASTGDGEAYINLGRKDHVVPGLTFAVYDPKLGVRVDNDQDAAGKGGLEVLEAGEAESLCRITSTTKGQTIQSGDLIANPVYNSDKNRKYRFVVFGDFDLDGDGQATSQERERIVRLIQAWGGIVDDALSTQTDFLVIGSRPAAAILKYEGADEASSIAKAQEQKQIQYDELVQNAKSSSVPILNQNRFLAMIGYYNTTIVHH